MFSLDVGKLTRTGAAFIPPAYNPTESDVRFVGACGILAIFAYGFAFIGAISYCQFALYAHIMHKYNDRCAGYFRSRSRIYSFMLTVAGFAQLLFGSYVEAKFGNGGALDSGHIAVAMILINFPAISIFLGLMQMCLGIWGLLRSFGIAVFGVRDFSSAMFIAWVLQLTLQVLVQVGYVPGDGAAGAAPTITGFTIGLNFMPAYLDHKGRTLPEEITSAYYGEGEESSESMKKDEDENDDNV